MYRFCKQGSTKWYGIEIDDIESDLENIEIFVNEGSPVFICEDPSDLERECGIDSDDITIVD